MMRKHQTRNLEIPGSMLAHRPGTTSKKVARRLATAALRLSGNPLL